MGATVNKLVKDGDSKPLKTGRSELLSAMDENKVVWENTVSENQHNRSSIEHEMPDVYSCETQRKLLISDILY